MPLTPEEKARRAHERGLKANNVQRRRFEKMLSESYLPQAESRIQKERNQRKELAEQGLVLEVLDGSLDRLVAIRQAILTLKNEAKDIAREAKEHGLAVQDNGYGRTPFDFYIDPQESDVSVDACATPGAVDHLRGFLIRRCENNPWYAKLERLMERERGRSIDLQFDATELSQAIWGCVSTEEIVAKIEEFKSKWVTYTAGLED